MANSVNAQGGFVALLKSMNILPRSSGAWTVRKRPPPYVSSAFVLSQVFCRHRKRLGRAGRIINIGSLTCHGARPTTAAYASSKGGLLSLTKTLAVEWAKYNINVNAIGPGYIATELTEPLMNDKDLNQWVLSKTPLGRWGLPDDMIGTAVLLASRAGEFITGQIIYVDGGWLALL